MASLYYCFGVFFNVVAVFLVAAVDGDNIGFPTTLNSSALKYLLLYFERVYKIEEKKEKN